MISAGSASARPLCGWWSNSLAFQDRNDLNDRRKPRRLTARFRVRETLRHVRLEVLDRHTRRKCHGLLSKLADQELVSRRHIEHQIALLPQRCAVIRHQIDE